MKCKLLHESAGRMRVHAFQKNGRMTLREADILEYYLRNIGGVKNVKVFDRTCDIIIEYVCERDLIISALSHFSYSDERNISLVPEHAGRELNRQYEDKLTGAVIRRILGKLFLPASVRAVYCVR